MFIVFVTTLACGLLGILSMCRLQQVGWKFVRLVAIWNLCLLIPVLAGFGVWGTWRHGPVAITAAALTGGAALGAFLVLVLAPVARRYPGTIRIMAGVGALLALAGAGLWGFEYRVWPTLPETTQSAALASLVLMAVCLGSVTLATALGHAYLTHTSMTIHPLRRLARIFAAGMSLRLLWALLVGGNLAWRAVRDGRLTGAALRDEWLMLGVRGLIGLLIPLAFAYMVVETVRLRATQSATGILYFALVLEFIGELTSLHLLRELHIPF